MADAVCSIEVAPSHRRKELHAKIEHHEPARGRFVCLFGLLCCRVFDSMMLHVTTATTSSVDYCIVVWIPKPRSLTQLEESGRPIQVH